MRRRTLLLLPPIVLAWMSIVGCTIAGCTIAGCTAPPVDKATISGPLGHQAFVWQRAWDDDVSRAVRRSPRLGLDGVVALAAEIDHRAEGPRVVRVPLDLEALADAGPPALALRLAGLDRSAYPVDVVARTARGLVDEARRAGVELAELQIDHDCPTRRLAECAELLAAVRDAIAPTPLTFTALPSWLEERRGFERLLGASDGYVLQVHSLEAPGRSANAFELCDPDRARRAVAEAATYGRPFRVALPTHAYLVRIGEDGEVRGVTAEDGLERRGGRARLVASDPAAMAELVRGWTRARPAELRGVLWFRLPAPGDRLNWTSETLARVLRGEVPDGRLELVVRRPRPGLAEVDLVNRGHSAEPAPARLLLAWTEDPIAADGLAGYRLARGDRGPALEIAGAGADPHRPLRPGETRTVAWLRFADESFHLEAEILPTDTKGASLSGAHHEP